MNPMNHIWRMSYTEGRDMLHEAGLTSQEIEKLCGLRARLEQGMYLSTLPQNPTTISTQAQHRNWLEKALVTLLKLCRHAADNEAELWMYTHLPY